MEGVLIRLTIAIAYSLLLYVVSGFFFGKKKNERRLELRS